MREGAAVVVEQAAVEPLYRLVAVDPAFAHDDEQRLEGSLRAVGVVDKGGEAGREKALGKQVHVLGKHTKGAAVDEMSDGFGVVAVFAELVGELGEACGGVLGDGLDGLVRFEAFRLREGPAEDLELLRIEDVVEFKRVGTGDGVGEVGVDDDALGVADDKKRRGGEVAVGGL